MEEKEVVEKKIYCNGCGHKTNHIGKVIYEYTDGEEIDVECGRIEKVYLGNYVWSIFRCKGCDTMTIEEKFSYLDEYNELKTIYYPERNIKLLTRKSYINIPDYIKTIYNEIIETFNNSTFITDNIKKNLHGIRFLGNEATHDFKVPEKEDLELTVIVIEDILNTVYNLDYRSSLMHSKFKK